MRLLIEVEVVGIQPAPSSGLTKGSGRGVKESTATSVGLAPVKLRASRQKVTPSRSKEGTATSVGLAPAKLRAGREK
jgi:hypothetical protein